MSLLARHVRCTLKSGRREAARHVRFVPQANIIGFCIHIATSPKELLCRTRKGITASHFARQGMRVMVAFYECTRFGKQLMAWSEEDIVRALARVGTKGLTAAALGKAISAPAANKQLSSAITKLKSRGAIRGPFRIGRFSLFFEAKSAPTREYLESRIEDMLRRAGTRVTTRSDLDNGMKGVVQSLYKDAISALKAEGKIVELRTVTAGPHRRRSLPKRHPSRLKMFVRTIWR